MQTATLAERTHGFVGADLSSLCTEAGMVALRRLARGCEAGSTASAIVLFDDFVAALTRIRPSGMREVALELPKASTLLLNPCVVDGAVLKLWRAATQVAWKDVGGHGAIKQQLREAVEWPFRSLKALSRLNAVPPKGELTTEPVHSDGLSLLCLNCIVEPAPCRNTAVWSSRLQQDVIGQGCSYRSQAEFFGCKGPRAAE